MVEIEAEGITESNRTEMVTIRYSSLQYLSHNVGIVNLLYLLFGSPKEPIQPRLVRGFF